MYYFYKIGCWVTGIFLILLFIYSYLKFLKYRKQIKILRTKLSLMNCDLKDSNKGLIFFETMRNKKFKTSLPSLEKMNPLNDVSKNLFFLSVILLLSWIGFLYLLLGALLKVYEKIKDYGYEGGYEYYLKKISFFDIDSKDFYLSLLNLFEENEIAKRQLVKTDNLYDLLTFIPEYKEIEEDV